MVVSYDGTKYYGFQTQPIGNTIQDILHGSHNVLNGRMIRYTASGRTDAGVHARGQVINFKTSSPIPIERWALALNSRLPERYRHSAERSRCPPHFHASHYAKRKTYRYSIDTSKFADRISNGSIAFHHPMPLVSKR